MKTVDILSVRVGCISKWDILDQVVEWARQDRPKLITYVNAHCLNIACQDPGYLRILKQADLVYADGMGVVLAGRLLKGAKLYKVTGRDWIDAFCQKACEDGLKIYILAGKPGIASKACHTLQQKYPGLKITGAVDGFFQGKNEAEIFREIRSTRPQVVFVGMGVPRQEKWVSSHRADIEAPICWPVGALFDFVAGAEPPVPVWMNSLALEWLWRLAIDPTGKWKRYIFGNPIFAARVIQQKILNWKSSQD